MGSLHFVFFSQAVLTFFNLEIKIHLKWSLSPESSPPEASWDAFVIPPFGDNKMFGLPSLQEPFKRARSKMTLILQPNLSELELPRSESLDLEQVLERFLVHLSLGMLETPPSNNNSFHTPSWGSLSRKPWVFSVWWWLSWSSSLSKAWSKFLPFRDTLENH